MPTPVTPIRATYTSGTPDGIAEFQTNEQVSPIYVPGTLDADSPVKLWQLGEKAFQAASETDIPAYTWATKPSAGGRDGQLIIITNLGTNRSLWVSDGSSWQLTNGHCRLGTIATDVAFNSTTTQVFSTFIPGGVLINGSVIELFCTGYTSGTTDTKTYTWRMGTTNTASDAALYAPSGASRMIRTQYTVKRLDSTTLAFCWLPSVTTSNGTTNTTTTNFTVSSMDSDLYLGLYASTSASETGVMKECYVNLVR